MKGRYFQGRLGRGYVPSVFQGVNWCGLRYRILPDGTGKPDVYPTNSLDRSRMSRKSRRFNLRRGK